MPNHRGVPAAEKYAELLANGQERPHCACHRETMTWAKRYDLIEGGRWRCNEAQAESVRLHRHNNIEECRKRGRLLDAKRRSTPERRKYQTIYRLTYNQRLKREKYVELGLINDGLSCGNDGQEDHSRGDRAA